MNAWKTTVQPARRSVRLLMTDPEQNEVLKVSRPSDFYRLRPTFGYQGLPLRFEAEHRIQG